MIQDGLFHLPLGLACVGIVTYTRLISPQGVDLFHRSQIQTTDQCLKIKNLFEKADSFRIDEQQGKEYAYFNDLVLPTYDQESGEIVDEKVEMIYRHKVPKKRRFRIKSSDGKYVDVTDCHSIMVLENGELVEKKPDQLKKGDKIISLNGVDQNGKK